MATSKLITDALTKATSDDKVASGLTIIKPDPPRRFLALDDWGEAAISPEEFDNLRREVLLSDFPKFNTDLDEAITRACHLLFALVESGGLCVNNPQQVLPEIKIDTPAAIFGYLKQPVGRRKQDDQFSRREEDDEEGEAVAVRQPLHPLGANHLLSFTYYRRKIDEATDGENLLPDLPSTLRELRKQTTLEWLAGYAKTPKWSLIFNHWLKEKISVLRNEKPVNQTLALDWNDVRSIALWRLLEKERFPLLLAYRQRKLTVTNLPEKKMQSLLLGKEPKFGKEKRLVADDADDSVELMAGDEELPKGFRLVRDFLNVLLTDGYNRTRAVEQNKAFSDLPEIKDDNTSDLRHLMLWFLSLTNENLALRTVFSYGQIVVRFLEEIYPNRFADVTTSDVAGYLDNTCGSPNTVRSVRTDLRKFKEFLEKSKLPVPAVNWNSADLKAFEQGRERDILSEAEYQNVRRAVLAKIQKDDFADRAEEVVLLTLLRRCGLRVGEASWLVGGNLHGRSELRLRVPKSKTRTGTNRLIPIHLLLDEAELQELKDFFESKKLEDESLRFLFIDESGERTKAARLGVKAENILRRAGLGGETAHGLRHALASALFAALYLKSCIDAAPNRFTEILRKFCRPEIEEAAATHPYHIQLILGHADLFVTFDRYIHLVEIAVWHALESWKTQGESEKIQRKFAAKLLRIDDQQLKSKLLKTNLTDDLSLPEINKMLIERLKRVK